MLTHEEYSVIKALYPELVNGFQADNITPVLFQQKILNVNNMEAVHAERLPRNKMAW